MTPEKDTFGDITQFHFSMDGIMPRYETPFGMNVSTITQSDVRFNSETQNLFTDQPIGIAPDILECLAQSRIDYALVRTDNITVGFRANISPQLTAPGFDFLNSHNEYRIKFTPRILAHAPYASIDSEGLIVENTGVNFFRFSNGKLSLPVYPKKEADQMWQELILPEVGNPSMRYGVGGIKNEVIRFRGNGDTCLKIEQSVCRLTLTKDNWPIVSGNLVMGALVREQELQTAIDSIPLTPRILYRKEETNQKFQDYMNTGPLLRDTVIPYLDIRQDLPI